MKIITPFLTEQLWWLLLIYLLFWHRTLKIFCPWEMIKNIYNWNKTKFLTNFIKLIKLVPVQCYLKTLWTRMCRSKLYVMLFKRVQTTLHIKNSVQCCLNTFRTTFHRSKLYAMLYKKLQKHCIRKNPVQCYLNNVMSTFDRSKLYAWLSKRHQTTLHKKKSCSKLSSYSWENIAQNKTLLNVV